MNRALATAIVGQHYPERTVVGADPAEAGHRPTTVVRFAEQPSLVVQLSETIDAVRTEAALVGAVTEILGGARKVADLFAGCGTFTFPLARRASVHAVEGAPGMVAALQHAARHAQGLRPITAAARDLFRNPLEGPELAGLDGAVIDPPRAGAAAQIAALAQAQVPRIAHVSCSPTSFARDAARLVAAGYAMGPVCVVDQFRWSAHVELVAGFTLRR